MRGVLPPLSRLTPGRRSLQTCSRFTLASLPSRNPPAASQPRYLPAREDIGPAMDTNALSTTHAHTMHVVNTPV